ncbi:branched-chain amino acid ABC transporter permease [Lentibacillus salinarum]|uniref:Branched-chain amino acid ABC transporter permease n=1 Tax=Lentibacillus salinarum TaxID=446820 RepID=A0ABW3ZRD8_9BACI
MRSIYIKFGLSIVLLGLAPFFLSLFYIDLLSEILILAIFALGLNILVGYTGLISLGHAAFFGIGGYTAALIAQHFSSNLFMTMGIAILGALLVAGILGVLCIRVNGFYFLMLTLALSQMIYSFIHQSTDLTGGSNGLSGIPSPEIAGFQFSNSVLIFYLTVIFFMVVYLLLRMVLNSPFGTVLIGIRENEDRIQSMGYNTGLYKYAAFILAGGIGGIAGAMYTYFNGFIAPSDVYWTMSGNALFMVIIGGAGTMLGPILGAGLIVILETIVSSYTELWMLILGAVFIVFVVFFPKGIVGMGQDIYQFLKDQLLSYNKKRHIESKPNNVKRRAE